MPRGRGPAVWGTEDIVRVHTGRVKFGRKAAEKLFWFLFGRLPAGNQTNEAVDSRLTRDERAGGCDPGLVPRTSTSPGHRAGRGGFAPAHTP